MNVIWDVDRRKKFGPLRKGWKVSWLRDEMAPRLLFDASNNLLQCNHFKSPHRNIRSWKGKFSTLHDYCERPLISHSPRRVVCTRSSRHPRATVLSEPSNDRQYHTLNLSFGQLEVTSNSCSKHQSPATMFNMAKPEPSLENLQNEWKQMFQKTLPSAALSKSDAQVRSWIPSDYLDDSSINVPCSQNGQYTWIIISNALFWTMLLGLIVIGRGRLRVLLIEICQGNSVSKWIFLNSCFL